jgi:hypothetical protein
MTIEPTTESHDVRAPTPFDAWTLGRARLVAFKAERLLTEAKRELGAFGEPTMGTSAGPELLRASEHVTEALRVLEGLQQQLRGAVTD